MPVRFRDLERAAYCPRQAYYGRGEADKPPPKVGEIRALAFRYPELAEAADDTLAGEPVAVAPARWRRNLARSRERVSRWSGLVDPPDRDVIPTGKDARGVAHKFLADPPVPCLVYTGAPPEQGVWEPQSVRAVAAAKALAWERKRPVERAVVEYPGHGVVREIELTGRRRGAYRRALRALATMDGPPPRLSERAKCSPCDHRERCWGKTRTLRSLLGR